MVHGKRDGVEQEQVLVQHFTGMKLQGGGIYGGSKTTSPAKDCVIERSFNRLKDWEGRINDDITSSTWVRQSTWWLLRLKET